MRTKKIDPNHDASTATIVLIMPDGTKFYRPFVNAKEADTVFWKLKELHPQAHYLLRLGPLNLADDHVAISQLYGVVSTRGGMIVEDVSETATNVGAGTAGIAHKRTTRRGRKPTKRANAPTSSASV